MFQKWFKSQTKAVIIVQVDIDKKDAAIAQLKELGYHVINN